MTMDLAAAYSTLTASPNHRVLRRVPELPAWPYPYATSLLPDDTRVGVVVDTETTGTGEADEVVELAMLPFQYDRLTGHVVSVGNAFTALRQTSIHIPLESTKVHGITDADVAGKSIDPAEVTRMLDGVQLVIAHKAGFDRPMCEKLWPCFEEKHWACSLEDIDWREEGFSGRALDYLLFRQGWFYDGHRALADATALLWLLTLPLPTSGRPALAALLETARKPVWEVRAHETAYEYREALKARGYRWDPGNDQRPKAWVKMDTDAEADITWLREQVYATSHPVDARDKLPVCVNRVPPNRRFSGRV